MNMLRAHVDEVLETLRLEFVARAVVTQGRPE